MIASSLLAGVFCFLLVSLLGDQLKNLCSNSTSYERAKNLSRSTLLESTHDHLDSGINNPSEVLEEEDEEEPGCLSNCCTMLREPYEP